MKGKTAKSPVEAYVAMVRENDFVIEEIDDRILGFKGIRVTVKPGEFCDAVAKLPNFLPVSPKEHLGQYLENPNPPKSYFVEDETADQVLQKMAATGHTIECDK